MVEKFYQVKESNPIYNADIPEDLEAPEGYEEMKGSEFYQIVELVEGENNG